MPDGSVGLAPNADNMPSILHDTRYSYETRIIPGIDYKFLIRTNNITGHRTLHGHVRIISDTHLGTPNCRAKVVNRSLHLTSSDVLSHLGDKFDLQHMRDHQDDGQYHQAHVEVLAYFYQEADRGVDVSYTPGNHDDAVLKHIARLSGKRFHGIRICESFDYNDLNGDKYHKEHNHKHDKGLGSWYALGTLAITYSTRFDAFIQQWPLLEDVSLTSLGKRCIKLILNFAIKVRESIEKLIRSDPTLRGQAGGHSHHAEITNIDETWPFFMRKLACRLTRQPMPTMDPNARLRLNPGCGTENGSELLLGNGHRKWVRIKFHKKNRVRFIDQNGNKRYATLQELGLDPTWPVQGVEKKYVDMARRTVLVLHRLGRSINRQRAATLALAAEQLNIPVSSVPIIDCGRSSPKIIDYLKIAFTELTLRNAGKIWHERHAAAVKRARIAIANDFGLTERELPPLLEAEHRRPGMLNATRKRRAAWHSYEELRQHKIIEEAHRILRHTTAYQKPPECISTSTDEETGQMVLKKFRTLMRRRSFSERARLQEPALS